MENKLYLDIETIPSQDGWVRDYVIDDIKPPGNIKKQESIDAWYAEKFEDAVQEALLKTSFDGAMCHVVAIGYAVNDDEPKCMYAEKAEDEKKILESFFKGAASLNWPIIVGHNVTGFDMRVLRQRAIVLGVSLPKNLPWEAKPWDKNPFDTMVQWDAKNSIKLDKLACAMGIKGKNGIDGSKVYEYWQAGKHEELIEYCKSDVCMVRDIAKRMMI